MERFATLAASWRTSAQLARTVAEKSDATAYIQLDMKAQIYEKCAALLEAAITAERATQAVIKLEKTSAHEIKR